MAQDTQNPSFGFPVYIATVAYRACTVGNLNVVSIIFTNATKVEVGA